jgi:hypothetical protein
VNSSRVSRPNLQTNQIYDINVNCLLLIKGNKKQTLTDGLVFQFDAMKKNNVVQCDSSLTLS